MRPDMFLQMKESVTARHRTSKRASVHVAEEGKYESPDSMGTCLTSCND